MYQFKFNPTEELAADLFRLPESPTKENFEQLAQKHNLEIFPFQGKMTLGFKEDMKHHRPGHIEAGYIQTEIPA